ncbi:MAG: penicillin acylase family protein, partial [Lysobacteraceae bacterium]
MWMWIRRALVASLLLATATLLAGWAALRGSVPAYDGELALPGLSAPVSVTRDALGVVTIDAANRADMARALGFVHGQERYFEMDLMRRLSGGARAGRLGGRALPVERGDPRRRRR